MLLLSEGFDSADEDFDRLTLRLAVLVRILMMLLMLLMLLRLRLLKR
jgi:hypothetical protein